MTPERWQQVKAGFTEAVELEGPVREAYLAACEERDPDLRRQVESLLAAHSSPDAILNFDVRHFLPADADVVLPDPWLGRRVGVYELLECIGRGGMGAVYRARRADTEYTREVAIKLVRAGFANDLVLQRLRTERQILADLDHPNIARLLDGGVTDNGEPFLVLELVQGEAIDKYCANRQLSVSDRISLFREVCAAVAFAHRHLVVHRDLKPSNILVTDEGAIKLLDFGIAKLLQPATVPEQEEDATRTLFRAMTPAFSSPEQILGLKVTTASDVYSLGVVLFHLLCGVGPYRSTLSTHREVLQAICEDEPRGAAEALRQSSQSDVATIDADLDSILSKALRKEPERRFSSVEQLSEDLRRYLDGMPVIARGDRFGYRMGKYWRRNKAVLSAVILVAIALIGGLIMTLREAHLADQQRDLAAKRFNDTRQLAHAFIFDVQDAVRGMPGAGRVREILVRTGLKYLDSLSSDARDDRSMLKELAESYVRMGDVQGEPQSQNRGEPQAAVASYAKALQLFERASSGAPSPEVLVEMAQTRLKRGNIMMMLAGDPGAAAVEARKATDILELRLSTQPGNQDYLYDLVRAYAIYTQEASFAGDDAAVDFAANRSISLTDANFQQHPREAKAALMLGTGYLIRLRPPHQLLPAPILEERLALCRKALSLDQRFMAELNSSPRETNTLIVDFNNLGIWLGIAGRFKESAQAFAAAVSLSQDQFDRDPHNAQWKLDNVRVHMNLDRARIRSEDFGTAQADLIRVMPAAKELEKNSNSLEVQYLLATLEQELGTIEMRNAELATSRVEKLKRWQTAHELFASSVARYQPIATTARLDLNDRPPVDWAAEGLERSEAELNLLAVKPPAPAARKTTRS